MQEDYAPIILFIYNRPDHTRRTLQALQQNLYADASTLYVFADGQKPDATEQDLKKIAEARTVIGEQQWCKEVHITEREQNMNLEDNVIDGVTRIINQYGTAIVLEDDIVTSPYFLKYCNDGLKMYRDEKNIFAINAFMLPIDLGTEASTFLCPLATSSWGWATWADRWAKFEHEPEYIEAFENNLVLQHRFNFGNTPRFYMLKYMNTWDIRWYYTAFIRGGLGVFPTKPLTVNIGFDGSGTHTGNADLKQDLYLSEIPMSYHSTVNMNFYSKLLDYFKIVPPTRMERVKAVVKKIIRYRNS